ncbi:sensor histidine kinase [Magnetospirillum molischianum]|uniref:histidine kinase n=1 Tax=Magnetospirillum molischianum DSM 120 TaxID=1150626 RepID=H8FS16_MAGML|nr:PAS domain-containing sensor histidine kinase [Magnetospirillum molischianum]CCG41154.1 Putative two-component sensor histidine kinase, classical system [Magnetospirillum molischianum DSM 120]
MPGADNPDSNAFQALDNRVLGQLLLMQSVIAILPEGAVIPFVLEGFADLPGVATVAFDPDPNRVAGQGSVAFSLSMGGSTSGNLLVDVVESATFAPYCDYLRNFCFMVAVILEERRLRRLTAQHQEQLEDLVAERTRRLTVEVEAHQQAVLALSQRDLVFHRLVQAIPHGIVLINTDGSVGYLNPAFTHILGYTLADIPDSDLWWRKACPDPLYRQMVMDSWQRAVIDPPEFRQADETFTVRHQDGSDRIIAFVAVQLPDQRVLVTLDDVTERKRAAEDLRDKNAALERSNAELEAFSYAASHDLREPLRNIKSFTTLLARRLDDRLQDEEREIVIIITDAAARMDALVRDLLDLSLVGRIEKPMVPVSLHNVAMSAMNSLRIQIETAGAIVAIHSNLPTVIGNSDELCRVFVNLIGNALKYRRDAPPEIDIDCQADGEIWLIQIRDNGIGIETGLGYEERIFGLFQRLHHRNEYSGTGIGLPICRKIITRHGGRIWIESEGVGRGLRCCFTLPAITV